MEKLLEQMKNLAIRQYASKLCLFGSRARGDFRPDSDYDFALWGIPTEQQPMFKHLVEDEIPTLKKIDIVFVSPETSSALLNNIQTEGVIIMNRYQIKLDNYQQAVARLKEGIVEYVAMQNSIIRDGVIQRFEFTCELAWKTTREYLLEQGYVNIDSPKAVMKQAYSDGLISDNDGWISLLTDRNLTSHLYDESTASQIMQRIEMHYFDLFKDLLEKLQET